MKTAALCLLALFFCGCAERPAPVVPGKIAAPDASGNVTAGSQALIAGQANAEVNGDHKAVVAIGKALVQEDRQEIAGSNRWLVFTGILVLAVGLGIMYYLGPKLGGGVAIVGAAMIGGALFVSAILPYVGWIVFGGSAIGLIAAAWHFRAYASAAAHMAHGTEAYASAHVKGLIGKIRARGPGIVTRLKAILHHQTSKVIPPKGPSAP